MNEYFFEVKFSDGYTGMYQITASTAHVALEEMLEQAECDAIENDCKIIDYKVKGII